MAGPITGWAEGGLCGLCAFQKAAAGMARVEGSLAGRDLEIRLRVSQSVLQMRKFQDRQGLSCGHRADKGLRAGGGTSQGRPPDSICAENSAPIEQAPGAWALPVPGPPLSTLAPQGPQNQSPVPWPPGPQAMLPVTFPASPQASSLFSLPLGICDSSTEGLECHFPCWNPTQLLEPSLQSTLELYTTVRTFKAAVALRLTAASHCPLFLQGICK